MCFVIITHFILEDITVYWSQYILNNTWFNKHMHYFDYKSMLSPFYFTCKTC